jgi:hypothetical protein
MPSGSVKDVEGQIVRQKKGRQIARCSGTKGSGQRSGEIDMQELKIKFPWRNADRTTGAEIATAHAMHPLKHYGYMRGTAAPWREKGAATDYAFFAQCRIRFMDVTGLARFYDYEKTLGSDSEPGPCVDHSAFWVTPDERFVITTEPYGDGYKHAVKWCREHDWNCEVLPVGIGMWHPIGENPTRLVISSPKVGGADISTMAAMLKSGMPVHPSSKDAA